MIKIFVGLHRRKEAGGGVATNKERLFATPACRNDCADGAYKALKLSGQGVRSREVEGQDYGVQARRRDGEAAG
jgi:hypothetical protein